MGDKVRKTRRLMGFLTIYMTGVTILAWAVYLGIQWGLGYEGR